MTFTSFSFLLFVFLLLPLYYTVPKKWQWILLLAASYAFYLRAGMAYLSYILFTTCTTYGAARMRVHS